MYLTILLIIGFALWVFVLIISASNIISKKIENSILRILKNQKI